MEFIKELTGLSNGWCFVIHIALIVIIGLIGVKIIVALLKHVLKKSNRIDDAIAHFVVSVAKVACYIILIAIVLQAFGASTSSIVAVLGAAGAAIALALKDSLANIAGGIMIVFNHPFNKGDLISIGEDKGRVEAIDLFVTTLRTLDYRTITIPNGLINTSVVYNESDRDVRRCDMRFSVAYESDLAKVKEVLRKVCADEPMILDDPKPWIGVGTHEDSGIVIECFAYCQTPDYFNTQDLLNEKVKTAFEEAGIEIPYPHMDVKIEQ